MPESKMKVLKFNKVNRQMGKKGGLGFVCVFIHLPKIWRFPFIPHLSLSTNDCFWSFNPKGK